MARTPTAGLRRLQCRLLPANERKSLVAAWSRAEQKVSQAGALPGGRQRWVVMVVLSWALSVVVWSSALSHPAHGHLVQRRRWLLQRRRATSSRGFTRWQTPGCAPRPQTDTGDEERTAVFHSALKEGGCESLMYYGAGRVAWLVWRFPVSCSLPEPSSDLTSTSPPQQHLHLRRNTSLSRLRILCSGPVESTNTRELVLSPTVESTTES